MDFYLAGINSNWIAAKAGQIQWNHLQHAYAESLIITLFMEHLYLPTKVYVLLLIQFLLLVKTTVFL